MLKYHNQNQYTKFLRWSTPLLDLFSQPPALRIMKKQRFTTLIGHFFSIIIATVCLVYLVFQLQDLINEANPSVIFTEEQMINSDPIYLSQNNFTFVVVLSEWNVTALTSYNKNFQFIIQNCQRRRNLDSNGSLINVTSNCTTYTMEPCQMDKHFQSEYQKQFFKSLNLKNMYCPNNDQWTKRPLQIQGAIYSKDYQYLQILTTYCRNVTVNSTCNPINVQQQAMATGIYSVYISDTLNKLAQPGYPFEPIIQNLLNTFSATTSKDFLTNYKQTRTNTDTGTIQSKITEDNAIQISTATQTSDFYNGQYLVNHLITLDSKIAIYDRQYVKLAQILGQLGGLWQVLYLVAKILIGPFVSSMMNLEIATKIFTFSQNKSSISTSRTPKNNIVSTDRNSLKKSLKFPDQKESIQVSNKRPSEQIDQYLKQRRQSSTLNFKELFYMICGCKQKEKQMISYATEKVLDITYILKKIVEIDKLKLLILNEKQIKLFQYLPKPYIPLQENDQSSNAQSFIFKYEKSDQTQFQEACQSYHNIKNQTELSHIDQILLHQLDDDMVGIFNHIEDKNHQDFEINVCSQQLQSQYKEDDLIMDNQSNKIQIPKSNVKKH